MDPPEDIKPLVAFPKGFIGKGLVNGKPLDNGKEHRKIWFVDYDNLEKGVVSGFTEPGSPCSLDLLEAIMANVQRVYYRLLMDVTEGLEAEIPIVLDETKVELKRLLQHPELFPDGAQQWFPQVMKLELRKVSKHMALQYALGENMHASRQESVVIHRKRILPDYDIRRTMWQQFLHGQAPGSGVPRNLMRLQGCTQMVTAGCFFMILSREREYLGYTRALERARNQKLPPRERHIAGRIAHRGYKRTVVHRRTSWRPGPRISIHGSASLRSLAMRYHGGNVNAEGFTTRL
ncbi:MAG: hypothetical protein Q9196_006913 [Gyalolechia fulgens]